MVRKIFLFPILPVGFSVRRFFRLLKFEATLAKIYLTNNLEFAGEILCRKKS